MTSRDRAIELLEVLLGDALAIPSDNSSLYRKRWETNIALVENALAAERRNVKRNQVARMLRIIGGRHHTDQHCGCDACGALRSVAAAVIRKKRRKK